MHKLYASFLLYHSHQHALSLFLLSFSLFSPILLISLSLCLYLSVTFVLRCDHIDPLLIIVFPISMILLLYYFILQLFFKYFFTALSINPFTTPLCWVLRCTQPKPKPKPTLLIPFSYAQTRKTKRLRLPKTLPRAYRGNPSHPIHRESLPKHSRKTCRSDTCVALAGTLATTKKLLSGE